MGVAVGKYFFLQKGAESEVKARLLQETEVRCVTSIFIFCENSPILKRNFRERRCGMWGNSRFFDIIVFSLLFITKMHLKLAPRKVRICI